MTTDEIYMHRCLELARLGAGNVAPNPMVGAVLVHTERIIGEGYHEQYGKAHAEVNCINSVAEEDKHLIEHATLYVSLEPCAHFGKTPPCADLIIDKKIPKVVIGCRDAFKQVDGKGIEKLQQAGITTVTGVLEKEATELNQRFFTFHTQQRPYVILKWAQTANGKIAAGSKERLFISNEYSNRIVHKWRSEEMAILVGTNTALQDDPELTTRLWKGKNPIRLVIDKKLRVPATAKLYNDAASTIVFNIVKHDVELLSAANETVKAYYQVTEDESIVQQILNACYENKIQSILVEGGAKLLQSFIDEGCWDEARIITNETLFVEQGLAAPCLHNFQFCHSEKTGTDRIDYFRNTKNLY